MSIWNRGKGRRIYADAAAATLLSSSAQKELLRLLHIYGNPGGLHMEGVLAQQELTYARERVAGTLGAHADEIIFTSSGTEANNLAIMGVLRPLLRRHGPLHAITSAIEHPSVLEPLRSLGAEGLTLTELPVDREGLVSSRALGEAVGERTVLLSLQLVNSEVGTIQPLREVAKEIRRIRKERKSEDLPLYFHTDAAQAPLWLPLQVEHLGIDLLTLDGQKILGPKGVGILCRKRGVPLAPYIYGGGQEGGLRSGTENLPLIGACSVALAEAQRHQSATAQKITAVRDLLWQEIKKWLPEAVLLGPSVDGGQRVANILSVAVPGLGGEMAVIALSSQGIATSTRSACAAADEEPSHVIAALGTPQNLLRSAIRISLLPSATPKDARRIAEALARVAERYKNIYS